MTSEDLKHPSKRSQFNAYNFLVCYLVSLGQIAFGHPASIIGTTLGELVPRFDICKTVTDLMFICKVNHLFMCTWAWWALTVNRHTMLKV
jgi:hypothetical protein